MRFSLAAAATATLIGASFASAEIMGITVPSKVYHAGDMVPVTFHAKATQASGKEYAAIFGITQSALNNSIGSGNFGFTNLLALGHAYNGGAGQKQWTVNVKIPQGSGGGPQTTVSLNTAVYGLVGAAGIPTTKVFSAPLNVQ